MISLCDKLPVLEVNSAELVKINCLYDAYKNDGKVMFWTQDGDKAVISMTDGNMIIHNNGADIEELGEFVNALAPACIFSDYETLGKINRRPKEPIYIMCRNADLVGETSGDSLSSKEIYSLLDVDGLSLPEYPFFAVDYCHRLNNGGADYFALRNKCAVITFKSGKNAIINGIASHEKGFGSVALRAIIQKNFGRRIFVCCREKVKGFYEKEGFKPLYLSGYWVREDEYN